jgi:hypothetical protein
VTLVEAREINPPANVEPLMWRLLTSMEVSDADGARDIVRLHRLMWRIELFSSGSSSICGSSGSTARRRTR